jgi:2-dehydropantoate 2-reductase
MSMGEEIRSLLVVGAGAIGVSVAGAVDASDPSAVSILAGSERLRRYRQEGFILNGVRRNFALVSPADRSEPDLIIVAVKSHQLERAVEDMRGHVGPSTVILSLLNGITSEDTLSAAFGREKVLYAMILGIDAVREGNSTRFSGTGKIHFGDASNVPGSWSDRVSSVARFFQRTGVSHVVPENMIRSLWYKFMINVGINQVSAVLRAPYGVFQFIPEAKEVMESAMRETVALSKSMGTGLQSADVTAWYDTLSLLAADGKTSMLQDVEAGRKTEVEVFGGRMIELGESAGLTVPVNRMLFKLIRAIERGYGCE